MNTMCPIREDFAGQRQLRFRIHGKALHLFKNRGESTHQVYLKVLAYALYGDDIDLVFEPRTDYKVSPDLGSIDLTGEVRTWIQCGNVPIDEIAYVLRHADADRVIWVRELDSLASDYPAEIDLAPMIAYIRRHIHYRYTTGKLRVVAFRPLDDWFLPDDVTFLDSDYGSFDF